MHNREHDRKGDEATHCTTLTEVAHQTSYIAGGAADVAVGAAAAALGHDALGDPRVRDRLHPVRVPRGATAGGLAHHDPV